MKTFRQLLQAVLFVLLIMVPFMACNHEGPLIVPHETQVHRAVVITDPYDPFMPPPIMVRHHILLPTDILPANVSELSPWVDLFIDGKVTNIPINPQDAYPGYENHYHLILDLPLKSDFHFFVNYGNANCGCSYPQLANVCGVDNYAVHYFASNEKDANNRKRDQDTIYAFHVRDGSIQRADKQFFNFLSADIVREAGSVNDVFYLTNKKYTQEIGIRAVNWKFSDGASVDKEIDAMIYHKPKNDGQKWVLVTITDNLGNKKTLSSSWW